MKKLFVLIAAVLTTNSAFAGYGVGTVDRYYVDEDGLVMFGLTVALTGTCNYFIDQFRFSNTTPGGKSMLATLMAAKASGVPVTVWYTDSTVPGTNQNNGCNQGTMALVRGIAIR